MTSSMHREWLRVSPQQFERIVVECLAELGRPLNGFVVKHQAALSGPDGEFVFDAVASFRELGMDFVVLVECKHHKNPVKRELVQVLADKITSVRAQKGAMFSTAPFQSGALELARSRKIALIHVTPGGPIYETRNLDQSRQTAVPHRSEDCWVVVESVSGGITYCSAVPQLRQTLFEEPAHL